MIGWLLHRSTRVPILAVSIVTFWMATNPIAGRGADDLESPLRQLISMEIDGRPRTAIAFIPSNPIPGKSVVFCFHGHGGSAEDAERMFRLHEELPESILVYMQGLPVQGQLRKDKTRDQEHAGWQMNVAENNGNDLQFFDQILVGLIERYRIDTNRIFATGHSMGGSFTFLLWFARPDSLAAVAISGASVVQQTNQLKPKPMIHFAGRNDKVIPFSGQEKTMKSVRRLNQCDFTGKVWEANGKLYKSPRGNDVVTYVHEGGHEFPEEAPRLIARFFEHVGGGKRSMKD
jgi:polyhydroxybutyrate depolymerase